MRMAQVTEGGVNVGDMVDEQVRSLSQFATDFQKKPDDSLFKSMGTW